MASIRNLHLFVSVVKIHLQQHRTSLCLLVISNNRLYIFFFRIVTGLQLNVPIEVTPEDTELDHRLHFQLATEHFSHDNEQIKFHFKVPKNDKTKILIKSFLFFFSVLSFVQRPANISLRKRSLPIMEFIYFNMIRMLIKINRRIF